MIQTDALDLTVWSTNIKTYSIDGLILNLFSKIQEKNKLKKCLFICKKKFLVVDINRKMNLKNVFLIYRNTTCRSDQISAKIV